MIIKRSIILKLPKSIVTSLEMGKANVSRLVLLPLRTIFSEIIHLLLRLLFFQMVPMDSQRGGGVT